MSVNKHRFLVSGAAGFIGYHLAARLLSEGSLVFGVDNISDYYDVRLKEARLDRLIQRPGFTFRRLDIGDVSALHSAFEDAQADMIIHLAAQVGVRYSVVNPLAYAETNLVGFTNVLEAARQFKAQHLIYASSSSVYGASRKIPFRAADGADHPLSLYGATKRANELMAHAYSHLYGLPTTGLRFFTVYGPWGRPDMALFMFTDAIVRGKPISVFNNGHMSRDLTYVDDVVESMVRLTDRVASPDPNWDASAPRPDTSAAPYRVFNIGNRTSVPLLELISAVEQAVGSPAKLILSPAQPGDVLDTLADVRDLEEAIDFQPDTPLSVGVRRFVDWYRMFYKI